MEVVTPGMRDQRRRRRAAERAGRGEIRRRPPTPHPAGLRAQGWNRPSHETSAVGGRLLGAASSSVAITDRATLSTARRTTAPTALGPTPVARGPLPAAASLPRPARLSPRTRSPVEPVDLAAPQREPAPAAPPVSPPPATAPTATPASVAPPAPAAPTPPTAPAPSAAPTAAVTATGAGTPTATPSRPAAPPSPVTAAPPGPPRFTPPAAPLPSDLFAHALGLSPATAPAPPAADQRPPRPSRVGRRPRDPWAEAGESRRGRRLLVAAAVVVVLGGVGTAVGVTLAGRDDTTTTTTGAAAAAAVVDSSTWLSGNVSPQQRIVTSDATLAADLNGRGVPVDVLPDGTDPPSGAILVARSDGASPDAVTPVGQNACVVLLADFSDGGRTVTVGEVVASPASEVTADLASAASTAASAAAGLRNNAAVRIATDLDPLFTSGRLDLRAATLLAAVAQDQQVEVVAAPQDRAESRAGRPVRTLVVSVQDTQAVREIAATARSPYAPDVEVARPDDGVPAGSLLLTWPAGAAITKPFQ